MEMPTEEQIQRIVELAVIKLDLKYTEAVLKLQQEIPKQVHKAVKSCQHKHTKNTRWNISTVISILALMVAAVAIITK